MQLSTRSLARSREAEGEKKTLATELEDRCRALVSEIGLASASEVRSVRPLTGGVASDIAVVDLGDCRVCVKFALQKLRVAVDWQAPLHRNAAEYAWLGVAAKVAPKGAVRLLGHSESQHGFAMEFLDGPDIYLWKSALLDEQPDRKEAARVASLLGRVHSTSTQSGFRKTAFRNRDDFRALRIEPYLSFTREAHPTLADTIRPLEDMLYASERVLVHGDASPKNIMFRKNKAILLDAECASMGDASFDPAFCLNHLALKAVHLPTSRQRLLADIEAFWRAYAVHVTWENVDELEARVCALLPALMLARVDGKSPVEYLSDSERDIVRHISIPLIISPVPRLTVITDALKKNLNEAST